MYEASPLSMPQWDADIGKKHSNEGRRSTFYVAAIVKLFLLSSLLPGAMIPRDCGLLRLMGWELRDAWGFWAPNDLLSVVTSRGHAPDPACALSAWEASGGQPLLIIGAPCEPVPHNELPSPAKTAFALLGPVPPSERGRPTPQP